MIVFLLFVQLLFSLLILYKELFVNKLRNLATSIFFSIYSILFILIPIVLHCFYGGAKSIVAGKDNLIVDFDVYLIYNVLGLVLLGTSLFIVYNRTNVTANYTGILQYTYLTNKIGLLIIFGLVVFIYSTGLSLSFFRSYRRILLL